MSLSGLAVEEAGDLRQIRSERRLYVINIIETGTDLPSRNRQQRHRKIWRSGSEILLDVLSAVRPAGRTGYSAFFAPQLSRVCPLSACKSSQASAYPMACLPRRWSNSKGSIKGEQLRNRR